MLDLTRDGNVFGPLSSDRGSMSVLTCVIVAHPPKPVPGLIATSSTRTAKVVRSQLLTFLVGSYTEQLKGTARSVFTHILCAYLCTRSLLMSSLRFFAGTETGDPHAVMRWTWTVKFFHERVFCRYECALRGWPEWIVLRNLSRHRSESSMSSSGSASPVSSTSPL